MIPESEGVELPAREHAREAVVVEHLHRRLAERGGEPEEDPGGRAVERRLPSKRTASPEHDQRDGRDPNEHRDDRPLVGRRVVAPLGSLTNDGEQRETQNDEASSANLRPADMLARQEVAEGNAKTTVRTSRAGSRRACRDRGLQLGRRSRSAARSCPGAKTSASRAGRTSWASRAKPPHAESALLLAWPRARRGTQRRWPGLPPRAGAYVPPARWQPLARRGSHWPQSLITPHHRLVVARAAVRCSARQRDDLVDEREAFGPVGDQDTDRSFAAERMSLTSPPPSLDRGVRLARRVRE